MRLGQLHLKATSTWSTAHSYGSALVPVQRPHTSRESQPELDHRAGTASGCAADTDDGRGANANTCSTCQRPELMTLTVVKGCDNETVTCSQSLFDRLVRVVVTAPDCVP